MNSSKSYTHHCIKCGRRWGHDNCSLDPQGPVYDQKCVECLSGTYNSGTYNIDKRFYYEDSFEAEVREIRKAAGVHDG